MRQNLKRLSVYLLVLLFFISPALLYPPLIFADKIKARSKADLVTKTLSGNIELCLSCHDQRPDKAHGREVLGCVVCHRGNPLEGDKDKAHKDMIFNPGELKWADKTCGATGCHTEQVKWVKNSLMATNRGILSTLRFYWGESPHHNEDISIEVLKETGLNSPSLDYARKLCGTCHLWLEKDKLPDFLAEKGGGCTACHYLKKEGMRDEQRHPWIVREAPMENCVRCHNRSGRIGLSYQGKYESEGYGTPFEDGGFSRNVLIDGRFYNRLPDDVHHRNGLICIDCHTQKEVMGEGKRYAHFEEQLEIDCESCHGEKDLLERIASKDLQHGLPSLNIAKEGGKFFLVGKKDKKRHNLNPPNRDACKNPQHRRLSCQACHSTWVPQCYGCHVRMDGSKRQLDKVTGKMTQGFWEEFRGLVRYENPPLGVLKVEKPGQEAGEKVVNIVPG